MTRGAASATPRTRRGGWTPGWQRSGPLPDPQATKVCPARSGLDPRLWRNVAKDPPARYDFILASKGDWDLDKVTVAKDWKSPKGLDCSDHWPVRATLALKRSAVIPPGIFNSESEADRRLDELKGDKEYGVGSSTRVKIHNATGETLSWVTNHSTKGRFYNNPPAMILPGHWAAFLHVHPTSSNNGSEGSIVYAIGAGGPEVFCGFRTTHSVFSGKNRVFTEIKEPGHYGEWPKLNYSDHLFDELLANSDYDKSHENQGYVVDAHNSTGDTSTAQFTIRKK